MKSVDLAGGRGWVLEDGEEAPVVVLADVPLGEKRVLAAVAVVEKTNAAMFAEELAKVKAKQPAVVAARVGES